MPPKSKKRKRTNTADGNISKDLKKKLNEWDAKPFALPNKQSPRTSAPNVLLLRVHPKHKETVDSILFKKMEWIPLQVQDNAVTFVLKSPKTYVKASTQQLENREKRMAIEAKRKQLPIAIANSQKAHDDATAAAMDGDMSIELGDVGAIGMELAKLKRELKTCDDFKQESYHADLVILDKRMTLSVGYHRLDGMTYSILVLPPVVLHTTVPKPVDSLDVEEASTSTPQAVDVCVRSPPRLVQGKLVREIECHTTNGRHLKTGIVAVNGACEIVVMQTQRDGDVWQFYSMHTGQLEREVKLPANVGAVDSIAVDHETGIIYVAAFRSVAGFDCAGEYLRCWNLDCSFDTIAISTLSKQIYVRNIQTDAIQVYDPNFNDCKTIPIGGIHHMKAIALDSKDNMYILHEEYENSTEVVVFNPKGKRIHSWGEDGQFKEASSLVIDAFDRVFVADEDRNDIQIFTAKGEFVSKIVIGEEGEDDGIFSNCLAFAPTGELVVNCRDKVCVFA